MTSCTTVDHVPVVVEEALLFGCACCLYTSLPLLREPPVQVWPVIVWALADILWTLHSSESTSVGLPSS